MNNEKIYEDWQWHTYYCGEEDWEVHNKFEVVVAKGMTKEVANLVANLPELLRRIDKVIDIKEN